MTPVSNVLIEGDPGGSQGTPQLSAGQNLHFFLPLLDQVVFDRCEVLGIWRSHTSIHEDPQVGVGAVQGGLKDDLLALTGRV